MNYSKYYDLEKYLFGEVRENYFKRGYLTAKEFFCIVIWKANRAKTKIKKKLLSYGSIENVVKEISSQIFKTEDAREKLDLLLKNFTFGMPMASAILSVLYPDEFTVYDYRVRDQLGLSSVYSSQKYFEYFLPKVQTEAKNCGLSLRDMDRELWGKSFFQDLKELCA